jgi:hypothetical protein
MRISRSPISPPPRRRRSADGSRANGALLRACGSPGAGQVAESRTVRELAHHAGVELRNSRMATPAANSRIDSRGIRSFAVTVSRAVTAMGVLESKTSIESSTCSPNALLRLVVRMTTTVTTAVADDGVRESAILRLRELTAGVDESAGVELPQSPANATPANSRSADCRRVDSRAKKKTPAAGAGASVLATPARRGAGAGVVALAPLW